LFLPYTPLMREHPCMFGSVNVLVGGVEVKEGDIFTVETLSIEKGSRLLQISYCRQNRSTD
jgi:hypothetical protein